jgi:hypothetical protein
VELRDKRFKKEKRWRANEAAWRLTRAGSGVTWDERMDGALSVFREDDEARKRERDMADEFKRREKEIVEKFETGKVEVGVSDDDDDGER